MVRFDSNSNLGMRRELTYVLVWCRRNNALKQRGCGTVEIEVMGSLEFLINDDTCLYKRERYSYSIMYQKGEAIFETFTRLMRSGSVL